MESHRGIECLVASHGNIPHLIKNVRRGDKCLDTHLSILTEHHQAIDSILGISKELVEKHAFVGKGKIGIIVYKMNIQSQILAFEYLVPLTRNHIVLYLYHRED